MSEYTKKQAIQDCLKLWTALTDKEHLAKMASDYSDTSWLYAKDATALMLFGRQLCYSCPCCEFVQQAVGYRRVECCDDSQGDCSQQRALCPLAGLWPDGCRDRSAAYDRWCRASKDCGLASPEALSVAQEIVDFCKKELA